MNRHGSPRRPRRASVLARIEALEPRQLLATLTVINTMDSGAGSLRAAIQTANMTTGSSTIDFHIAGSGVETIALQTALPTVINPVIIDGTSQPGYAGTPLIELEGAGILDSNMNPVGNVNGLALAGGSSTVEGLTIDRFTGNGIAASLDSNTISADFIGTDPTGSVRQSNGGDGVALSGLNNTVGGLTASARNVISGNGSAGIYLGGTGSSLPTGNLVVGNLIGTNAIGTGSLGNAQAGIDLESSKNTVGGAAPGTGNIIAFNGGAGVQVGSYYFQSGVIDNRIEGNQIFQNVGLGIDLGKDGVTDNIPDQNFGPNDRQTFPVLTSAYPGTTGTVVEGTLVASPSTLYAVDFYANTQPDPTGYGQGQTPILTKNVMTDANGYANVITMLPTSVAVGQYVSATATDPNGNTSEFSHSQVVTTMAEADLSVTSNSPTPTVQAGTAATYSFTITNNGPSTATNVLFKDLLPAGAVFVSGTTGTSAIAPPSAQGLIETNLGTLTIGASTTVTLKFTLPTAGSVTNQVSVVSDQSDTAPLNNTLTQDITVLSASPVDLSIYGSASPNPVQVGQMLTYTFIVSNYSDNTATGVLFDDPLPAGLSVVSIKSSQGPTAVYGNDAQVDLGTLGGGTNAEVTVVADALSPRFITNTATVAGNQPDPNIINNSTTVYSTIAPAPAVDIAVAISAAPVPAAVGQPFLYVITVGNPGSAPATGVTLSDVLPANALITSIKPSAGAYSISGNDLTVDFGDLPIGGLEEVTVALLPGSAGFLVNQASVTSNQPEFSVANNFATSVTPVAAPVIAPSVMQQSAVVSGNKITNIILTFNEDMNSDSASMTANYQVLDLGSNGSLSATGPSVAITSAKYNSVTRTVTLGFKSGLSIGKFYKIIANGPGAPGLVDVNGNVLDGENNGLQNSIYESLIARGTTKRPVALQVGVTPKVPTPKPPAKPAKHHHK